MNGRPIIPASDNSLRIYEAPLENKCFKNPTPFQMQREEEVGYVLELMRQQSYAIENSVQSGIEVSDAEINRTADLIYCDIAIDGDLGRLPSSLKECKDFFQDISHRYVNRNSK